MWVLPSTRILRLHPWSSFLLLLLLLLWLLIRLSNTASWDLFLIILYSWLWSRLLYWLLLCRLFRSGLFSWLLCLPIETTRRSSISLKCICSWSLPWIYPWQSSSTWCWIIITIHPRWRPHSIRLSVLNIKLSGCLWARSSEWLLWEGHFSIPMKII